jgi:toxin-antitoxin system PIN domain toxin
VIGLLDVNVLVALVLPVHVHHGLAHRWLEERGEQDGWATCAFAELGAVRVCAQLPEPHRPAATLEAIALLCKVSPRHEFWPDVSPTAIGEVRGAVTAKQVNDRYLLGLARRRGGRVVTFDQGLAQAGGADVDCLGIRS